VDRVPAPDPSSLPGGPKGPLEKGLETHRTIFPLRHQADAHKLAPNSSGGCIPGEWSALTLSRVVLMNVEPSSRSTSTLASVTGSCASSTRLVSHSTSATMRGHDSDEERVSIAASLALPRTTLGHGVSNSALLRPYTPGGSMRGPCVAASPRFDRYAS
jgi:hypothetical protein